MASQGPAGTEAGGGAGEERGGGGGSGGGGFGGGGGMGGRAAGPGPRGGFGGGLPGAGGGYGGQGPTGGSGFGPRGMVAGGGQPSAQPGVAAPVNKTFAPPDKCLLRFLDVTVQPGKTYEYRVKIKIANPTYGKDDLSVSKEAASEPVLVAPEWKEVTQRVGEEEVPLRVTVADELMYYAVDEKLDQRILPVNSERTAVQVHKWLEEVRVNPRDPSSVVPVGEWALLERLLVHRGEYIGRQEEVDVPVWRTTSNGFALAGHSDETPRIPGQRLGKSKGVVVDFATDPVKQNSSVLVDFEGGKLTIRSEDKLVSDESPVEMLVLDASGKLLVHNGATDTEDQAHRQRHEAWKGELAALKNKEEGRRGPGDDALFQRGGPGRGGRRGGGG